MASVPKRPDRRVARTRRSLQQAFHQVAAEKGFMAMTVQDIAERAGVNRGTFYAHYADKYALYDAIVREEFRELLVSTLPPVSEWDRRTLRLLIRTVLECVEHRHRVCHLSDVLGPVTERATHDELYGHLLAWLNRGPRAEAWWRVRPETVAQTMTWAIVGAAAEWKQNPGMMPAERMADDVLTVIMEGVARLAPDPPPA